MFPLPITAWVAIGAAVVIGGMGIGLKVQTSRLASAKAETVAVQGKFDAFVAQAKALGDIQNSKAKAEDAANKTRKEKSDAENAKTKSDMAGVYAAYRKLRDSRTGSNSSFVPVAAPGTASPATASFDRSALDRGLQDFDRGVTGLLERGDSAITDLSTARKWAQSR